jgi:hypothetical protein
VGTTTLLYSVRDKAAIKRSSWQRSCTSGYQVEGFNDDTAWSHEPLTVWPVQIRVN